MTNHQFTQIPLLPVQQYRVIFTFPLHFFWLHHVACGILVPWPGWNPCPLHWECGVSTTGPPRKSLPFCICNSLPWLRETRLPLSVIYLLWSVDLYVMHLHLLCCPSPTLGFWHIESGCCPSHHHTRALILKKLSSPCLGSGTPHRAALLHGQPPHSFLVLTPCFGLFQLLCPYPYL